jgi:hypothetical protein
MKLPIDGPQNVTLGIILPYKFLYISTGGAAVTHNACFSALIFYLQMQFNPTKCILSPTKNIFSPTK